MKMHQTPAFALFLALFSVLLKAQSTVPPEIERPTDEVARTFGGVCPPGYRVEVMLLTEDVNIDPPPSITTFPRVATVALSLDASSGYAAIRQIVEDIKKADWKKLTSPRYPRYYWRVIGPKGNVLLGFLVDPESEAIGTENGWYKVSHELSYRTATGFAEFVVRRMREKPEDFLKAPPSAELIPMPGK
jgi:hypothetical protein